MDKAHESAEQRDAAVRIGTLGTILQVAFDGTPNLGELAPNLVVAASLKVDFEQVVAIGFAEDAVVKYSFLAAWHLTVVGVGLVLLLVSHYPVGQRARGSWWLIPDNGPVDLMHVAVSEHVVEAREGFGGAGEHDKSEYRTVESVDYSKEYIAWFGVGFLYVCLDLVAERSVACFVSLNDLSRCFGDDDDVVVFVYYFHKCGCPGVWALAVGIMFKRTRVSQKMKDASALRVEVRCRKASHC